MLVVLQGGAVQIRHVLQGTVLLQTTLPSTHELVTPWDPIITTGTQGAYLYVRCKLGRSYLVSICILKTLV